jgi:predicted Zn-ribbon and HTH transcriptional regulator
MWKKGELCTCSRESCGYQWIARVDNPRQCPRCKNTKLRRIENGISRETTGNK